MNRGAAELVCLNQMRYMLAQGYEVVLVLLKLFGDRLLENSYELRLRYVSAAMQFVLYVKEEQPNLILATLRTLLPMHLQLRLAS